VGFDITLGDIVGDIEHGGFRGLPGQNSLDVVIVSTEEK